MEGEWLGKDKKLVIWMNGKKTRLKRDDHILDEKYSIKEFNEEHAAAIEDSDIPELTRQDGDNHNKAIYYTRKSRFRAFKPFLDRKSTRLNSSHVSISYAVF